MGGDLRPRGDHGCRSSRYGVARPAGWSEREAAVQLGHESNVSGGCLPSLTLTLGRSMKVVAEKRREIWVSFVAGVLGLMFAAPRPMGYGNVLVLVSCLLVSMFCGINAVLDTEEMSIPGKFFAVIWLGVILLITVWVL